MNCKKAICIYGASREDIPQTYKDAAYLTGQLIAASGATLVSGGGRNGLMRCAINGATDNYGETIGVLPEFMVAREWQHPRLTQMIVKPDMHSRKETMASLSTGIIALPGGVGTLDELMEIITWRQLKLYTGPIVILNTNGFYDPLLDMLAHIQNEGFMRNHDINLWKVASTPEEAVEYALK